MDNIVSVCHILKVSVIIKEKEKRLYPLYCLCLDKVLYYLILLLQYLPLCGMEALPLICDKLF